MIQDVMQLTVTKPPAVPGDLWTMLTESERAQVATEDGGFLGHVSNGPWKCHYFTTWDHAGNPIATYDKTPAGWVKRKEQE